MSGSQIDNFREILKVFSKEIQYADAAFETYFIMKFGDKQWEKAYKVAPAFFSLSIKGMLNESLLSIAKLYESGRRSDKNLAKVLNYVESNLKFFEANQKDRLLFEVKKYKEEIDQRSIAIGKIMIWRDKLLAHFDNDYFINPSKIGNDVGLSAEEIRDLINNATNLINSFAEIMDLGKMVARYNNFDDVRYLVETVLRSADSN